MKTKTIWVIAVVLALGPLSGFRMDAQINIWTNQMSGKWEAPTNWSLGLPPMITQSLFITNIGADLTFSSSVFAKQVIVDAATSGNFPSALTVSNVFLAGAGTNLVNW